MDAPIQNDTRLSFSSYLALTCKKVSQYYFKLLKYTWVLGAYYFVCGLLVYFFQGRFGNGVDLFFLCLWILFFPLLGGYWYYHEHILFEKPMTLSKGIAEGFKRLSASMGAVIGIVLFPGLIIGTSFALYLGVEPFRLVWAEPLIIGFTILSVLIILNTRFLSLLMVMVFPIDSVAALDRCKLMIQGRFIQTFFRSFVPFALVISLYFLPIFYAPFISTDPMTQLIMLAIVTFITALLSPYLWGLMITDLHDLDESFELTLKKMK